jgi:hypothetical protein
MTLELPRSRDDGALDDARPDLVDIAFVTWFRFAEDRWIVVLDDVPLGRIERDGARYIALDRRGAPLGVNGTLRAALDRFEELAAEPPVARRGETLAALARHPVATIRRRAAARTGSAR